MKHNPGNIIKHLFVHFLLLGMLWGEDFVYNIHAQKQTPYLKEPLLLSVDINQSNPDIILFFRFKIDKSRDYRIRQINTSHNDTLHHSSIHYRYLLYPLKTGDLNVSFTLVKRVTDEEKVAYSFSGDRDDFKKLETTDTNIAVAPLLLHVRPLPPKTDFIGNFKIEADFPRKEADAFEALPMRVIIEGSGYPPLITQIIPKEANVTHFDSKPLLTQHIGKKTIRYHAVYDLALSSAKSFTLPKIIFRAFDPEKEKTYTLAIPSQHFTLKPADVNSLIDKVDSPAPFHSGLQWVGPLFSDLLIFLAGFASAWLIKWKRKERFTDSRHPFADKIDACKDKKTLLQLLLAYDSKKFAPTIEKLETDLYGKKSYGLNVLKQEAKEIER